MNRPIADLARLLACNWVTATAAAQGFVTPFDAMAVGHAGYGARGLFTVGETLDGPAGPYAPPGKLDGIGAYEVDAGTVRVLTNHELSHHLGYDYDLIDGSGGTFTLRGARVSFFDIEKATLTISGSGVAYDRIYDANGNLAVDRTFLSEPLDAGGGVTLHQGLHRFCSGSLLEAREFGGDRGLVDRIYFVGEETGGGSNTIGGAEWGMDTQTGALWALPDLGRGAWENVTTLDTGASDTVALVLMDDTSPFDADAPFPLGSGDLVSEAAPLYLYIGTKDPSGDFPARNGLRGGTLHVWVADDPTILTPAQFNGSGSRAGSWVAIDSSRRLAQASSTGSTGYDEYGYPTQRLLWLRAEAVGAFGFSRPEDISRNPADPTECVLASTGVDTFVGGVDTFGTVYTLSTDFATLAASLSILYDGDADPSRALRSPDNLDWADDGHVYVQEDEAEERTLTGEPLFGAGAINPNEAGIVRIDPATGTAVRVANIDRSVVVDPTIPDPFGAVDRDAGAFGEWESSGILDVSALFGRPGGTLFVFDVQAHGIDGQQSFNPTSRLRNSDLVEGGQLAFLERVGIGTTYCSTAPNSAGAGATIWALGSGLIADNDLTLAVLGLPPSTAGLYLHGSSPSFTPLGDGFLCLGGSIVRLQPAIFADASGRVRRTFDLSLPPMIHLVVAGSSSHFQLWYRDVPAGMTGANLTDGVTVDWQ